MCWNWTKTKGIQNIISAKKSTLFTGIELQTQLYMYVYFRLIYILVYGSNRERFRVNEITIFQVIPFVSICIANLSKFSTLFLLNDFFVRENIVVKLSWMW